MLFPKWRKRYIPSCLGYIRDIIPIYPTLSLFLLYLCFVFPIKAEAQEIKFHFSDETYPIMRIIHPDLQTYHESESHFLWHVTDNMSSEYAMTLALTGQCEEAQGLLKTGTNDEHMFYLGNCFILTNQNELAINAYRSLLDGLTDYQPIYIATSSNLAWAYQNIGQPEDAQSILLDLLTLCEQTTHCTVYDRAQLYTMQARLLAESFQYDEAMQIIENAISEMPDYPQHYVTRGQIQLLLYEWDEALADFDYAIELYKQTPNNNKYAEALFYRGVTNYTMLNREQALDDFLRLTSPTLYPHNRYLLAQTRQFISTIRVELNLNP